MTKILTTRNAQITTAAVEVKTLTISGKQVTLAVFRQLREEPLISESNALNGVPWGVVNYHPDKCADEEQHVHIVWQQGDALLRSKVFAPDTAKARSRTFAPGLLLEACFAEGIEPNETDSAGITGVYVDPARHVTAGDHDCSFVFDGTRFRGKVRAAFANFARQRRPGRAASLCDVVIAEAGPYGSFAELADRLRPTAESREMWRSLADLPQLFIAV